MHLIDLDWTWCLQSLSWLSGFPSYLIDFVKQFHNVWPMFWTLNGKNLNRYCKRRHQLFLWIRCIICEAGNRVTRWKKMIFFFEEIYERTWKWAQTMRERESGKCPNDKSKANRRKTEIVHFINIMQFVSSEWSIFTTCSPSVEQHFYGTNAAIFAKS